MSDAREGRGAGNGKGKSWYDAPLWANIEKKKKQQQKDKDGKL